MFNKEITEKDRAAIGEIVRRHVGALYGNNKETRYDDCYREGMDEVTKYCRDSGLPTLGYHMVEASCFLSK